LLPCIPAKSLTEGRPLDDPDKWLEDSDGIVRMCFSAIDYQTIHESYDIKFYRWCWAIHWAWKKQKEVNKFVNMNNDIKVKFSKLAKTVKISDPKWAEYNTKRNRAKIDNNAFYGKFGEEIIKEGKTPYLDEDTDELVVWKVDRREELTEGKRKFLPVAIAITAWGRQQLVIMANILGEHFLYCDTDSVHYLKDGGDEKIAAAVASGIMERDPEKLGAWKHEGNMKKGRYLRSKAYMEETEDGHMEVTLAGLPADPHSGQFSKKRSCLNWDNFHVGHEIGPEAANKLRTIRTPTGNKLIPTGFKIKEKESLFGL
jgi:hypothetical protein